MRKHNEDFLIHVLLVSMVWVLLALFNEHPDNTSNLPARSSISGLHTSAGSIIPLLPQVPDDYSIKYVTQSDFLDAAVIDPFLVSFEETKTDQRLLNCTLMYLGIKPLLFYMITTQIYTSDLSEDIA